MNMRVLAGAATLALLLNATDSGAVIGLDGNWKAERGVPMEQWEVSKLETATLTTATTLSATSSRKKRTAYAPELGLGFRLYLDGMKYYVKSALFMAKDRPGEVCTPSSNTKTLDYKCEEGQSYKVSCHLMFFNAQFENVGVYRLRPQERYETFCNAVLAIGAADKGRDEMFVTYQYFPIDRPAARKVSEIGDGWTRMTSQLRLTLVDGRFAVEEDTGCIPNPNTIETIPDARVALKRCRGAGAAKQRQ